MRGKFGKPVVKRSDRDESNLIMHQHPGGLVNEGDEASASEPPSDYDALNSEDNGEYCDNIDRSPTEEKVQNWRQLFDQEELDRAYRQSMIGFGKRVKDENRGIRPSSQPDRVSERDEIDEDVGATPVKQVD